ncbi:MAG: bifunctional 3-demethylubiquinone-9 3-methyltransferase/ 2-octaprenyl-6-hydroxy phenol methylase [Planctomycetes bacterium ADurb.Bin401]|nr:MAG: bifunctional 3-demethylubiquinone-9 3-methyltransferase/ 2-octaprenyl-6-hydroxy phenol methylase [Planctomycetes bacterium ADurb.Bin401]
MTTNDIWSGTYKIPWDDPDFSRRMLKEHLSQEHDLASRRNEWIDRQVEWIHEKYLDRKLSRILDLGCGPGFYSHRLTKMGHHCRGIDFGPASIEYAQEQVFDRSLCEFIMGDVRNIDFGGPYDLVMFLYGELNVFSPKEALGILQKTHASLSNQGRIIVELQSTAAIEATGLSEPSDQKSESGLFSDYPHRCRIENQWLPDEKAAIQIFTVVDENDGKVSVYRSTTKAWPDDELLGLLNKAGFCDPSVCTTWPSNTDALVLWTAMKGND